MLSHSKRITVVAAVTCGLLVAACAPLKSLTALNALRAQLIRKYHDEVTVNLQNSRYLSIIFVNSPLNKQDQVRRVERAQDTARFIALNFEAIKTIDEVWISFKLLRRIGQSTQVRIVLASKEFQLLPDDVTVLARLAAYVPDTGGTR